MGRNITVATLNVRGLGSRKKQYQFKRYLERFPQIDVLAVQETKISSQVETERLVTSVFINDYDVVVAHAVGQSAGCLLLLKKLDCFTPVSHQTDEEGRIAVLDVLIADEIWRFLNVYAPNEVQQRAQFFERVKSYVSDTYRTVLLGDFNCTLTRNDRSNKRVASDQSTCVLEGILEAHGMFDAVEDELQPGTTFTHFQRDSHARLDRIYVALSNKIRVVKYSVHPVYFSDHCLVVATVGTQRKEKQERRGWRLWKLNVMLLEDEEFDHFIKDEIVEILTDTTSWLVAWETFKLKLRAFAIERSNILAFGKKVREKELNSTLQKVTQLESRSPGEFYEEMRRLKLELGIIAESKYEGAKIRSRMQHYLSDETPSKWYYRKEKEYSAGKRIIAMEEAGKIITDIAHIRSSIESHYAQLLGNAGGAVNTRWQERMQSDLPRLTTKQRDNLGKPLTLQEVRGAISSLTKNRTPGPDGIGAEFYVKYADYMAMILLEVYREAEAEGLFSPSFRRTHTVLIPKKVHEGTVRKVTDYRPITLCNVDYKVYAKVLASRLQCVMGKLVGQHQTCAIKGRSIQTNIHVLRTILDDSRTGGNQVAALQVDLAKAFDRVNHTFLFTVLQEMGIGQSFLDRVKLCYNSVATKLIVNNQCTGAVPLRSSVRQGCPLSPLLFDIYLEPLCQRIIRNENIKGYTLTGTEVKVLAYADDLAILVADKKSVTTVFEEIDQYCKASGAKINKDKSVGIWGGVWGTTPVQFEGIRWQTMPTTYLGVPLEYSANTNVMWRELATKVRRHANIWKQRRLSIFQRADVCNVFFVGKLIYLLHVLQCSRTNIQVFQRIFAVFIWNSSFESMRRENLFRAIKDGGLGLHHLFVKQLVMRLCFYKDCQHPVLRGVMQCVGCEYLPEITVAVTGVRVVLCGFYKEVVDSLQFLLTRFSREYVFTVDRKQLAADLVAILFAQPLYRQIPEGWPGSDILKRVKKMVIKPEMKTFFFKLHTRTLPVKAWLQQKGIFVPWTTNCRYCKTPETIEHVFLHCTEAAFLWSDLRRMIGKDLNLNPHTIRFLPLGEKNGVRYDVLCVVALYCLWQVREMARNEESLQPPLVFIRRELLYLKEVATLRGNVPEWLALFCDKILVGERSPF